MKASLFTSFSREELERKIMIRQLLYIFLKTIVTLILPLLTIVFLKIENFFVVVFIIGMSAYLYYHFLPYKKVDYGKAIGLLALHCNALFLVKLMGYSTNFGFPEKLVCVLILGIWLFKETYLYTNYKKKIKKKVYLKDDDIKFDGLLLRRIKENIYELALPSGSNDTHPPVLYEVKECIVGDLDTIIQAPPVVSIRRKITFKKDNEDVDTGIHFYFFQDINEIPKEEILLTGLVKPKEISAKCD